MRLQHAVLAGHQLLTQLARAHAEGRLQDKLLYFSKPKLPVVDELGYLPFEANAAHLFLQPVSRRCERGSMLVTSNRSVAGWGGVFDDAVLPPPSWTGCCTTATWSPPGATATAAREAPR